MKKRTIIFIAIAVGVVAGVAWYWTNSRGQQALEDISVPAGTIVFKAEGGTETMYLIFLKNSTYSLLARMHMGTMEFDHGAWIQNDDGMMTLTSQKKPDTIAHVTALRYKSYVALYSPDQNFIKISAASAEMLKKALDDTEEGRVPSLIFTQVNTERAMQEAGTPQPFVCYPELNKSRPNKIELHKGSPLAPNKSIGNGIL
jgi:hypothetical protein